MIAAIPFFQLGVYNVTIPGTTTTLPIDPWATLVCLGFILGLEVSRYRGIQLGLDVRDIIDGAIVTVLTGFFFGHVVTVLAYYPERLSKPMSEGGGIMAILRVWEGFASTGGFIGAVIGSVLFYGYLRKRDYWRHADVITFGFPVGWFFGRMGCGVVHDHIGSVTSFPLAMDFDHGIGPWVQGAAYASGIRHELGLYEALFMVPVAAAFFWLGRRDQPPGFFLGLYATLYAPVRFILDFLRNNDLGHQDVRYFGLTPAQYGCFVMFGAGLWLLYSLDYKGFGRLKLDGSGERVDAEPGESEPEPGPEAAST